MVNRRTVVPSRLENPDTLLDGRLRVSRIVRRVDAREQRDVHAKRLLRLPPCLPNGFAQCVRVRLCECSQDACETSSVSREAAGLT
jgi:hypothetical protein